MSEQAWAAGFFDGEGSTSYTIPQTNRRRYLQMCVVQKDVRPLKRFQAAVSEGNITGPDRKGIYAWRATGNGARRAMSSLLPWLSEPKAEQWEAVERTCVNSTK